MPHTDRARRKARADAKAKRALVPPGTEFMDMGPRPFHNNDRLLENYEKSCERWMSATAAKRSPDIPIVGRGNGNVRPGKDEY